MGLKYNVGSLKCYILFKGIPFKVDLCKKMNSFLFDFWLIPYVGTYIYASNLNNGNPRRGNICAFLPYFLSYISCVIKKRLPKLKMEKEM